jgi:dihydroorotate dehydrogenase
VKIAPDLTEHAIGEALEVCQEHGVAGVIATNTTVQHDGEQGGLSGRPLTGRSLEVVTFVAKHSELPVVGVGGIMSVDDALRMLDAGASLVQLYTGLIYHGPSLLHAIVRATR